jgi:hypothetical protein
MNTCLVANGTSFNCRSPNFCLILVEPETILVFLKMMRHSTFDLKVGILPGQDSIKSAPFACTKYSSYYELIIDI